MLNALRSRNFVLGRTSRKLAIGPVPLQKLRCSTTQVSSDASSVLEIGDVRVSINTPKNPELVPSGQLHYWGNNLDNAPYEVLSHLRWMAQKSLLGQDIFLTGPPSSNRKRLILTLAELCGWECEYLMITKDTTEADLKQRREIEGDSVVWCDSAPVKAAIHGRVLIIDGMENAERNVLPTINNLLENREMMLEDGRFLMKQDTIHKLEQNDDNTASTSARLIPVHPAFRVVALGLPVPPYHGRVLDPPLRSRFQSRFIGELSLDDALNCVDTSGFVTTGTSAGANEVLKTVAGVYEGLRAMRAEAIKDGSGAAAVPCFTLDGLRHCLNLLRDTSVSSSGAVSVADALSRSIPLGYMWRQTPLQGMDISASMGSALSQKHKTMLQAMIDKVRAFPVPANATVSASKSAALKATSKSTVPLTAHQLRALEEISQDIGLGRNICLLGGKGAGKSHLLKILATSSAQDMLVFPVYQEMSGRDLLQRRGTSTTNAVVSAGEADGAAQGRNTSSLWLDSPLTKAARSGKTCVLDGVDRIDPQALLAIRSLISSPTHYPVSAQEGAEGAEGWSETREIDLPSGERLRVHPDFRLIGLGAPPTKSEDARMRYLNSDLNLSYHLLPDIGPRDVERVLRASTVAFQTKHADLPKRNVEMLTRVDTQLIQAIHGLYTVAGKVNPELKPSLRHAQRIHATLRTMLAQTEEFLSAVETSILVHRLLSQALLVRFQTTASAAKFDQAMENAGIVKPSSNGHSGSSKKLFKFMNKSTTAERERSISVDSENNTVTIGNITVPRRACNMPELVPQPLFHENAAHLQVLESLLLSYKASYETDEKAILLIGNQGVGKNKLVDRLLQVLNAEREYIQLHRDTTIQSLTLIPLLEHGQLTFEDSPLVRAAATGRILICDEVDKAPLEVICMLKGLIGDGELVLHDGRRLLSQDRATQEYARAVKASLSPVGSFESFCSTHQIVPMHPDFRMFVLANRPGHPFQGNHFFRECGDLFACHVVENLDMQSEVSLLQAFAPDVNAHLISKLATTFAELRGLNDAGVLSYPFSAREAVAIVKHMQAYPQDSSETAVEDILGFDGMNPQVRNVVAEVFQKHGFRITADAPRTSSATGVKLPLRIVGGRRDEGNRGSKPRTGTNMPKHGKHDAENKPHVGGNTWAGGSGGSDTAGLGGRGGPYRMMDPGNHPTHQISDEDKAAVSKESRDAAAAMAREAFEARLNEISMGKNDYQMYQQYVSNISLQVAQLKEILQDISNRGKERVWLRNQSQGNLDDSKLVDGLSGERLVFKRRGYSDNSLADITNMNTDGPVPKKRIQFVVDVSGSMMRFNGMDRRLERMLEASLLIMEALPRRGPPTEEGADAAVSDNSSNANSAENNAELAEVIEYSITGHSGETAQEVFIDYPTDADYADETSVSERIFDAFGARQKKQHAQKRKYRVPRGILNERDKMSTMEKMVAHSQFCQPGDHTLQATEIAIKRVLEGAEEGDNTQRMVIVLSDANFDRYGIDPADLSRIMRKSDKVKVHMILIAGLRDEADSVAKALPLGYAHLCNESSDLPAILRRILVSSFDA